MYVVQFSWIFNVIAMQTDPETDEVTPEDQPTDQDMDQDGEGEKLQENNWLEDPTWSPEKLSVTMSKLKMKMTVKRYMTTQGNQIHKVAVG